MHKFNALLLCAGLAAGDALACGMTGTVVPFEVATAGAGLQEQADLPLPSATVTEVVRGIGPNHPSCDDTGLLTVVVDWPRGGPRLRDVGFQFEVEGPAGPYRIFPQGPVQGRVTGRRSEFLFLWRDGEPARQQPIDLRVEVRAVTADGRLGPATPLVVRVAPGS